MFPYSCGQDWLHFAKTSSSIALEVGRIRELSTGNRHAEALAAAETLAKRAPRDRDVLYLIAANQRCLNRIPDALESLQHLEQDHPRFSLLYQERGHCYTALRDAARAIDSFTRAVNLNPALVTSWIMLERLYSITGQVENRTAAAGRVTALNQLPPEVLKAASLFWDGDLAAAENRLTAYLRNTRHVEALRLLARVLLDRQKYPEALATVEALLDIEPANRDYLSLCAAARAGLGQHEHAIAIYSQVHAVSPESAELQVALGHSLQSVGRQKEAVEAYRTAAAARPSFGDAWWGLANLKTYRFSEDEIARMRDWEAAPSADPVDRYHLCFALGKAYEDRNAYAESWQFYERGNRLKRAESRYLPEIIETEARRQIELCTARFFAARAGAGAPDPDPIFIVGLPRSGSTLIEQILASHSRVEATHELNDIQRIAFEMRGPQQDSRSSTYPDVLAELSAAEFRSLGERYTSCTRSYRRGKPFFIDKMPNNFRHIGLIQLMLPNAKIIDARREPVACCFSNLKQLFARGQEFTYSVEDIARYYRSYLELMRHWNAVLPGKVLRVCYEDVIDDLEGNVRRILEFCGLEFEPACLEFYKTERSIQTASSEQVRQPIFREGLFQWRNYEPWLGPLQDALGDALTRYRE
jgi:tetratricopeptide (TPR) repeat protein